MDIGVALSLVQIVVQLLDSRIWMEIGSLLGVESQLEKLRATISTINAVLLDAEEQEKLLQYQHSHVERDRLGRLKEAVYQANDLFDEVATIAHRKKLMSGHTMSKEMSFYFSCYNQLTRAFTLSQEIDKIRASLDDTVKDHHHDLGLRHLSSFDVKWASNNPRETHSFVCEEDVIIGRDDDKRVVIDMLVKGTIEDVSFISIVGIGGLGKTTLAQLVYNDERTEREFPLKMWVCVSNDFNIKLLLANILAAATKQPTDNGLNMDHLQTNLRDELDGKKFLLVLDDVWNEDFNEWLKLRNFLIRGGMGSRIIVTTRSREVAKVVGSHYTHELEGLCEQNSWNLFERMALEPGQIQMDSHIVDIGREIVRKCAGVPLAIRVVGSVLRGKEGTAWRYFKNYDLANINKNQNGIVPVLKTSYYYLPFHLKSCLSYCAIFPKDYKIMKEDLIYLWMAQGFIMPVDGESFEDAGEEYFTILLQRCFFQDVERADSGEIVSCKIHDLIHDLAKEVAGTEILSSNDNTRNFTEKTRHLFVESAVSTINIERHFSKMKRLRTLLQPSNSRTSFIVQLSKVRFLRVLDLHSTSLDKLSSKIGDLIHLRYLDLSSNGLISSLPTSITELYNLQTLKLRDCRSLRELPWDLKRLVNLRYLDVFGCSSLTHMPPGMKSMTNLHKLTRFVIGGSGTYNAYCWRPVPVSGLNDLKYLTNLAGNMEIKVQKGFVTNATDARNGGYLINKPHLKGINIYWNFMPGRAEYYMYSEDDSEQRFAEALLQGMQPHPNLRMLELWYYPGVRFPSWEGSLMNLECCLPNLVEIRLIGRIMLENLPSLSQLRHLKVLHLCRLKKLSYLESIITWELANDELLFFPSLEKLELNWLTELKGWWKTSSHSDSGNDEMNTGIMSTTRLQSFSLKSLSHLKIGGCPKLTTFPLCPKLDVLEMRGFNEAVGSIIGAASDASHWQNPPGDTSSTSRSWQKQQQVELEQLGRLRKNEIDSTGYHNFLPVESFQCLSHLVIECDLNVEKLETLEVFRCCRLFSLQSLAICRYWKLRSLSGQQVWEHFTALESLRLSFLYELKMDDDHIPWRFLCHTLRSLELWHLPMLVKLPKGMRYLTSLQSLDISCCDNLIELPTWIGCLSSLQSLLIRNCEKLRSLPKEMCHLTSLHRLDILACSMKLKERCRKPTGIDWPHIQHIPHIRLHIGGSLKDMPMDKRSHHTWKDH